MSCFRKMQKTGCKNAFKIALGRGTFFRYLVNRRKKSAICENDFFKRLNFAPSNSESMKRLFQQPHKQEAKQIPKRCLVERLTSALLTQISEVIYPAIYAVPKKNINGNLLFCKSHSKHLDKAPSKICLVERFIKRDFRPLIFHPQMS